MIGTTKTDRVTQELLPARIVAVIGCTILAIHASGWLGAWSGGTFVVLGIACVFATIYGTRRWKPAPRWPWWTFCVALFLFIVGAALRVFYGTLGDLSAQRSLIPDLVSIPGYVVLAIGFGGLIWARRSSHGSDVDAMLDALVASLASLAVAWVFLIGPALGDQAVPMYNRLLLACYPTMSVFMVAVFSRLAFSSGFHSVTAFRLMLATMFAMLVGDVIYMFAETGQLVIPQQFIDLPYVTAFVMVTVAVLHPSMPRISEPSRLGQREPHRGRLAIIAAALCVPGLLSLMRSDMTVTDRVTFGVIVVLLTAAVALRVLRALAQNARSEASLRHQAGHDELTGLPNRFFMQQHLTRALAEGVVGATGVAVLFLDVDRFKIVNDTLGHSMGDDLLVAVARRLELNLRATDMVGRVGGDEFVIVLKNVRDEDHALEIANRVRLGFSLPFRVREAEIPTSTSIGVALQLGERVPLATEAMLSDADSAMYQVKDAGGDSVMIFNASMRDRAEHRLELERELSHALERGELAMHYQPVIRLRDGQVTGMEALLRWTHPTLGPVRPDVFIPVAEETGAILEIGAWVIDQACAQLALLRATVFGGENLSMAVNVSARQLRDDSLIDTVARALMRHSIPASSMVLELTESLLMEDIEATTDLLTALREAGVRISIDDFGTGYSSLAYLQSLPVDIVKIDRAFVSDIGRDGANTSLVSAVVAIADSLSISTVAEGVESGAQAQRLDALGCTEVQGYWYSPGVPADEIVEVLERLRVASDRRLKIVRDPA